MIECLLRSLYKLTDSEAQILKIILFEGKATTKTIMDKTCLSRITVVRSTKKLEGMGLIVSKRVLGIRGKYMVFY
ncbi:MAG: helix-turn-helix domain-containing protein, partial [Desulfonauticus sp.]|nr:helix-turn-helix domain-containing protein [Desulfonauticus sp.]